ncbi:MAG TPA: hypothetical protein VK939_17340 [Longimicrobiales bacterium]|nr:hypothetical protein [Longimicrobiales bacterium]
MMAAFMVTVQNTPLWKLVVQDIPHDVPAFVGYALILAFVVMVWLGSRKRTQ